MKNFGWHLILDIEHCDHKIKIASELRKFIKGLCKVLDMKAYGPCVIKHFGHDNDVTSGYTAYQLIETSNISCHFSEKYDNAYIDVFSCKKFEAYDVIRYITDFFDARTKCFRYLVR